MKQNIVLIGFMGCGKTSVGEALAKELSYVFLDTDQTIEEKSKQKISEIFKQYGEEYFRNLETETIECLSEQLEHHIVSTGGGLPLRKCNADILQRMGFVVYLKVSKESILRRLEGDTTRPLLMGEHVEEKVQKLLEYREPIYEVAAHLVVSVDRFTQDGIWVDRSFEEIVKEIIHNYHIMIKKTI